MSETVVVAPPTSATASNATVDAAAAETESMYNRSVNFILRIVYLAMFAFSMYLLYEAWQQTRNDGSGDGGLGMSTMGTDGSNARMATSSVRPSPEQAIRNFETKLESIVGLTLLKQSMRRFLQGEIVKRRQLSLTSTNTLLPKTITSIPNFVFTGNPGVGKTMMGQLLAETLFELGLVRSPTYRVVNATDLIGRYVGHTERNTEDVLRACRGGVVFIDEAYQLYGGGDQHYGKDALNVIMKWAEPSMPDRPIIILAGYDYEISMLMQHNPGYESRFPKDGRFRFENYSRDELTHIALKKLQNYDGMKLTITSDVPSTIRRVVDQQYLRFEKQNARLAGEFIRAIVQEQRARVFSQSIMDDRLFQVSRVDVEQAAKLSF
jgi:SpoVK/Ycf46/Vps4 family AAA+-type ATPase